MDDIILQELKCTVEQAVRPVRATMARKRRMREELLAHLVAIFEEEAARLGDERAALEQAKLRFGDPRELTGQIQETVPWWDRLARLRDAGVLWPGESLLRFTSRITVFTLVGWMAMMLIVVLPSSFLRGRQNELAMTVYAMCIVGIATIPTTLGFALLSDGMYRALYRREGNRSWRLAVVYALISLPCFPALALVWYLLLTGDFAMSIAHFQLACYFAPLAPVLFAVMARQTAEQMRHHEEWAGLEIDE